MSQNNKASKSIDADVAIVGGGIIGLLTARELSSTGARVTVFDRQPVARESSWAGGGILSPLYPWRYPEPVTRLALWSQHHYPELISSLSKTGETNPEYIKSGLLISAPKEGEIASKWSENHAISLKLVDDQEARIIQPGIKTTGTEWIWMPEVAQVRNPRLLKAIRDDLERNSVNFAENSPISRIETVNGRVEAIWSGDRVYRADRYLVTAGAWTGRLMADLGLQLQIEPVRGQMLLLKGEPGVLSRIVLSDSHYLIPRRDGRILVGSTLEYEGFDKSITSAAAQELTAAAQDIFPGILDRCELETQWAGLRPGSPEGVPYIGRHPGLENLFLCAGHFRNGFVLGPASARLAVDLVLGRPPVLDPDDYAPS